jgi:hypothetical protein
VQIVDVRGLLLAQIGGQCYRAGKEQGSEGRGTAHLMDEAGLAALGIVQISVPLAVEALAVEADGLHRHAEGGAVFRGCVRQGDDIGAVCAVERHLAGAGIPDQGLCRYKKIGQALEDALGRARDRDRIGGRDLIGIKCRRFLGILSVG